jgi:hypothetical protein
VTSQEVPLGRITLYVNGRIVASAELEYPSCEAGPLQCTAGGFNGELGTIHLFNEPLPSLSVASLFALGNGPYAKPVFHQMANGSTVAVFAAPPSGMGATVTPITSTPQPSASTIGAASSSAGATPVTTASGAAASAQPAVGAPPPPPRAVHKHVLTISPYQACGTYALPSHWQEANPHAGPLISTSPCENHALLFDHVASYTIPSPRHALTMLGGFKLILHYLSPMMNGAFIMSENEAAAQMELIMQMLVNNQSNQKQLLDHGPVGIRCMLLDHVPPQFRSQVLFESVRRLVMTVNQIDLTSNKAHMLEFASSLLWDFTYWRRSPLPVLASLADILRALTDANAISMAISPDIGIRRCIDNIRLVLLPIFADSFNVPVTTTSVTPPTSNDGSTVIDIAAAVAAATSASATSSIGSSTSGAGGGSLIDMAPSPHHIRPTTSTTPSPSVIAEYNKIKALAMKRGPAAMLGPLSPPEIRQAEFKLSASERKIRAPVARTASPPSEAELGIVRSLLATVSCMANALPATIGCDELVPLLQLLVECDAPQL